MARRRPINADLTTGHSVKPKAKGAPKALAGLVIVGLVFLGTAIVGGGGGDHASSGGKTLTAPSDESGATAAPASIASNNTTRIAASDPAAFAATVALAVYPSMTPAQRPGAVGLVDERWQNAVAGAVLMAPPLKAPSLISGTGAPPAETAEALAALRPGKIVVKPKGGSFGAAQAAAMETLRQSLFGGPPKHLVVCSEEEPAFAVPAAAWAARSGDPVLFAGKNRLPGPTAKALADHRDVPVYVLGPKSVIAPSVMAEIGKIVKRVKRVSGPTPAANAVALARYSDRGFGWNVNDPGHGFVVASANDPIEAALAAPLSASGTWGPLLLTESADKLPKAVREYLLDVKPGYTTDPTRAFYNHVWVIGDEGEIDLNQQAEINQLAELTKVGGER